LSTDLGDSCSPMESTLFESRDWKVTCFFDGRVVAVEAASSLLVCIATAIGAMAY